MDDLFQMSELSLHDLFSMGRGTYAGLVPAACQTNDDAKEEGAQTDEVRCRALSSCLAAPLGGLSFLRAAFHVVSADIDFLAGRLLLALHECGRNADSLCRRWPAHYDIHACTAAEPSSSAAVGQRAQQVEDDAEVYIMKALAPAPHDVARHPPVCTCVPAQVHVACSRPGQHQSHAHVYSCALMSLQNNAFHAPNSALSASWLGIQLRLGGRTSSTALLWYFACVFDGFCLCLRWYFACVFDGILPVSSMVFACVFDGILPVSSMVFCLCLRWFLPVSSMVLCLCLRWYFACVFDGILPVSPMVFACVSDGFCLCLRWFLPVSSMVFCLCLRWYFACVSYGILPVSPMVFCLCLQWFLPVSPMVCTQIPSRAYACQAPEDRSHLADAEGAEADAAAAPPSAAVPSSSEAAPPARSQAAGGGTAAAFPVMDPSVQKKLGAFMQWAGPLVMAGLGMAPSECGARGVHMHA